MNKQLPSSRRTAIEQGSKGYFTGNLCIHGHLSERNTQSADCYACIRRRARIRSVTHPQENYEMMRKWRARNPTYHLAYNHSHQAQNFAYNFKYRFKDNLAADYGIEDQCAIIELFHKRNKRSG